MKAIEDKIPTIFITFVVTVIVTIVSLDMYGYIVHSRPADAQVIEEFKLLSIDAGEQAKISGKDSGKRAECVDGYLIMRSGKNQFASGLLVDGNNRGVKCSF